MRRSIISLGLAAVFVLIWPATALAATQPRLGTATSFAVLAGAGITNTGATTITGDVGTFPTTSETGFASVTIAPPGVNHAGDAVTQGAKNDLVTAYVDAANQTPCTTLTTLTAQNLTPGTYCFSSSAQLTGPLTLSGFGVYVFQIGSALTTASGSSVLLTNNAAACGVWWQVTSSATFGTGTSFQGTVMALQSITMTTGATLIGRALARNGAVTLDTNTITTPAALCAGLPVTGAVPTPTPTPGVVPTPSVVPGSTGIPDELMRGQFPWLLILAIGAGIGATALGLSSRRRRRRQA
ncbi:MAG TPA: ice-binding family protein [Candidatus Dormibacteraeota bacterium]|nr:ice-binding family protein [Candidatus Dormibacteraeota bacterium]